MRVVLTPVRFETSTWESRAFSRRVFKFEFDERLNILAKSFNRRSG
jgi:hypothetical protein